MVEMNVDSVNMNQVEIVMLVLVAPPMLIMTKSEAVNGRAIRDILKETAYANMAIKRAELDNMQMGILVSIVLQSHQVRTILTMAHVIGAVIVDIIKTEILA